MLGLLDLNFGGSGLLAGMRLDQRMREHMEGLTFDDLPAPFVCVATEIMTGHEIWLHSGSLITAMRASYALPGVFEPINANGRLLVDGALVNPVPVSVCRAHEQRLVVAVNLHYDLFGRAAVVKHAASGMTVPNGQGEADARKAQKLGITGVMVEAFNIIQDRIARARLAGDPPDLSLFPAMAQVGLTEFHRASEAIDLGYEEAMHRMSDIKRLIAVIA